MALGWIHFSFDWDWSAAERTLQRAIELNTTNADAHRAYAHMLSNYGRHDEALVEARRARELDPRSLIDNGLEGQFLFYAGRLDEAEARFQRTLEIDPNYWVAYLGLGRVAILRERYDEALKRLRRARELSGDATEAVTQLGFALGRAGAREEALTVLRELESLSTREYVPAYSFAMILNGIGESDAALSRLEQSVDQREVQATFLRIDPRWDRHRSQPRFVALVERLNLSGASAARSCPRLRLYSPPSVLVNPSAASPPRSRSPRYGRAPAGAERGSWGPRPSTSSGRPEPVEGRKRRRWGVRRGEAPRLIKEEAA